MALISERPTMLDGFMDELQSIDKEAGFGKMLSGLALAGTLAGGAAKAMPAAGHAAMGAAKPAMTQVLKRPVGMGMAAGQMRSPDVMNAMRGL